MRRWIAIAALVGCSGPGPAPASEPAAEASAPAAEPAGEAAGDDVAEPAAADTIERAALLGVLDAGPGAFLGTVRVEAFFRAQRFAGWKLLDLDARYRDAGLRPGDVVTGANGVTVSKPEHLVDVFARLRTADSLVLAGERDGRPFELVFAIVGPAPAPAPAGGQK